MIKKIAKKRLDRWCEGKIYEKLAPALGDKGKEQIKGLEVTVWESPTAFASYQE
jgi:hypothetical protein